MKHLLPLLLLLTFSPLFAAHETIVKNQREFDAAMSLVSRGQKANIRLQPGQYVISKPVVARGYLQMSGNGDVKVTSAHDLYTREEAVRSTSTHYLCRLKSPIQPFSLFVDDNDRIIPVSESVQKKTGVNLATSSITGDGETRKKGVKVKIPISSNLSHLRNKRFTNAYGYFDCAWDVINVTIERSDNKWFYGTTMNSSWVPTFDYEKTDDGIKVGGVEYKKQ